MSRFALSQLSPSPCCWVLSLDESLWLDIFGFENKKKVERIGAVLVEGCVYVSMFQHWAPPPFSLLFGLESLNRLN